MALWTMGDLHLSLSGEKNMDVFGDRWEGYQQKIEKNWRALIKEGDTVIIPGDISWGLKLHAALPDLQFLNALPGKKILMRGNHDLWWETTAKMNRFFPENGLDSCSFLYNDACEVEGKIVCGSRGWFADETLQKEKINADYEKVVKREAIRLSMSIEKAVALKGERDLPILVFLHFPPVWSGVECREILDVLHKYDVKECFFGHIHGIYTVEKDFTFEEIRFHLVAADMLDFRPYLIGGERSDD